ncbi:hypothetical protein GCM10023185_21650 [Hymenobacter saemangeumensis]|uniref:LTD domain-containing protein n=1 Tax=Hymenobacter saemangeumensis TaxID=1084522 RepID=A0ABP8IE92_9BACT
MKHIFASLWLVLGLVSATASAQTAPPVPPTPPAGLQGQALRTWLVQNWYDGKRVELSYATARGKMYNYADNYNNQVECVYSGYTAPLPFSTTATGTTVGRINCEHTVPQSWFNQVVRMRTDIHHLFPTYDTWNNLRGSDPYAEIPDASTTTWMRNTTSQATIPTMNIDEWSEDTNSQFEPREDHKGNLARAVFYFYTMHGTQPALIATGHDNINSVGSITTLYQWHLADPVDAHEIERNRRTAISQGNYNPYINHPNLVAEAWGLTVSGPAVSFSAATGSIVEGNSGTSTYTMTLTANPAPTAPISVQLVLSSANSTASNGSDFVFTSPTTVNFAAGQTTATADIIVNGDTRPEADETVTLNITNPSTGVNVGSPSTHTLTILNDDGPVPTVAFDTAAGSIVEGNTGTSTYTVNVTLSNAGTSGSFTVPVSVDPSSTANSADFVLNTTSLAFGSGAPAVVSITVNGDLLFEPNETVVLRLGNPSNSGVLLGMPNLHTLTIVNDDMPPAGAACTKLFFTQYAEGSATNTKALEIYNPSNMPVSLTGKRVELFANGAATTPTSTQALTGTLGPGAVYVIANTGVVDAGVAAAANIQSNVAFFNGDDAVVLFDGTDTLDIIGVVGQRPTSWTTAGGGSTLNHTLVRLPNTTQGGRWNGPYGSVTWTGIGTDNFSGIGSYASTACAVASSARASATLHNGLEIYPNPASETVRLRLPTVQSARPATVEVLDQMGRVVRQRVAVLSATDAAVLDLRGLASGLYAVRVTQDALQYTGRVLVK